MSTKSIILVGMFAAVLAVMSQIAIPMPSGVPMTLQTFAVALAGAVLGWKLGALSALVYLLLGAAGVPHFPGNERRTGCFAGKDGRFHFWVYFHGAAVRTGSGLRRTKELEESLDLRAWQSACPGRFAVYGADTGVFCGIGSSCISSFSA